MPSNDFYKELSEHLGASQDMLMVPENAFISRCFLLRVVEDNTELVGYAQRVYGEPEEVFGVIEWSPNKRKLENLGWYNGEGEIPVVCKMRNCDTIRVNDRLQVEINLLGRQEKIIRELVCTDIKIRGRGSQAITYHLCTQWRQPVMSMQKMKLSFITPMDREKVLAGILPVRFTLGEQKLSKVELLVSRQVVKTFTEPPFECDISLVGRSGFVSLVLCATDQNMHVVEEAITIEVI